jgi:hypothetical protein
MYFAAICLRVSSAGPLVSSSDAACELSGLFKYFTPLSLGVKPFSEAPGVENVAVCERWQRKQYPPGAALIGDHHAADDLAGSSIKSSAIALPSTEER